MAATLPQSARDPLLGMAKAVYQLLVPGSFLNRIQIARWMFSMIATSRTSSSLKSLMIAGTSCSCAALCRAPAPFARYDFVFAA